MRLRAFVSSRMAELAPERAALKSGLRAADIEAWVFEDDAGARPDTIQQTFYDEVKNADVYIGVFWHGYGDYTIEEFEHARILGKPRFIYEKRSDSHGRPDPGIEQKRDPRLQQFLTKIGDVESGLTIRWFNRPDDLREHVRTDLVHWRARQEIEQARARRDPGLEFEKVLRDNVRKYWVDGALAGALHRRTADALGLSRRIELEWEAFDLPNQNRVHPRAGSALHDLFIRFERRQLILGPPGSGKTTILLQLARRLLERAALDIDEPVPVVFDLSTWIDPEQPLSDWMVDELAHPRYKAARKWSRARIERGRIAALLDGLDEVSRDHRAACVDEINRLHDRVSGIVVCASPEEFEEIRDLDLNGAIELRPIADDQIKDFLSQAEERLGGLRAVLKKGTDDELSRMATLPLTLNIMSLAYQDLDASEIRTRRATRGAGFDLLETYVSQMFKRVGGHDHIGHAGGGDTGDDLERMGSRLSWLAAKVERHGGSAFGLEDIQPTWLDERRHRLAYCLTTRTVEGAILGVAAGVFLGSLGGVLSWEMGEATPAEFVLTLVGGLLVGLALGIVAGLVTGTIAGVRDNRDKQARDIRPAEVLRWRWRQALKGGLHGVAGGVGLALAALYFAAIGPGGWLVFPILALAGGAAGMLLGGVRAGIARTKEEPNEGIRMSVRSAVAAGVRLAAGGWIGIGLILGLLAKEQGGFVENLAYGLLSGIPFGLLIGMTGFFWFGGRTVIRNKILRWMLAKFDYLPADLAGFLDRAASAIFLLRVGGAYRFVHRYFLKYFAEKAG